MRLRGKAKAGFYPTPPRVVKLILEGLIRQERPFVLDPCAGEGEALLHVLRYLAASGVGIELDAKRAKKAGEKVKVYRGDSLQYTGEGVSLLWLNPPYDHGEGERLELTFLKHWSKALVNGGVLVYIIPEGILGEVSPFLSAWYQDLKVLRFPLPEYKDFRQVVVLGRKREAPEMPHPLGVEGVLGEVPVALTVPGGLGRVYLASRLSHEEILALLEKSPLYEEEEAEGLKRPLLPLKDAHLALLLAGGLMDREVVRLGGTSFSGGFLLADGRWFAGRKVERGKAVWTLVDSPQVVAVLLGYFSPLVR